MKLVSGAEGAERFAQLPAGALVRNEFGRIYGWIVGPYISPDQRNYAADADALLVVVRVDSDATDSLAGHEAVISGRYLEPARHGPLPTNEHHSPDCPYRDEPNFSAFYCCREAQP